MADSEPTKTTGSVSSRFCVLPELFGRDLLRLRKLAKCARTYCSDGRDPAFADLDRWIDSVEPSDGGRRLSNDGLEETADLGYAWSLRSEMDAGESPGVSFREGLKRDSENRGLSDGGIRKIGRSSTLGPSVASVATLGEGGRDVMVPVETIEGLFGVACCVCWTCCGGCTGGRSGGFAFPSVVGITTL